MKRLLAAVVLAVLLAPASAEAGRTQAEKVRTAYNDFRYFADLGDSRACALMTSELRSAYLRSVKMRRCPDMMSLYGFDIALQYPPVRNVRVRGRRACAEARFTDAGSAFFIRERGVWKLTTVKRGVRGYPYCPGPSA